jgi:hypothetical protein
MAEKYCFHCEVREILKMRLEERVVDLDTALLNLAQLLGEVIAECPNPEAALDEARRMVMHTAWKIETQMPAGTTRH